MDRQDDGYESFFRTNWKRVHAYAAKRVGPDDGADIAAEAMTTAWTKWGQRPRTDADITLYWVLNITKHKVLHHWRSQAARRRLEDGLATNAITHIGHVDPAETIAIASINLAGAYQSLTPRDRAALLNEPTRTTPRPRTGPPPRTEPRRGAEAMRRARARARLHHHLDH